MDYLEQLKSPKWQKKRLEILNRDNFTCQSCGNKDSQLHVHHKSYLNGNSLWEYDDFTFITLCADCHSEITEKKRYIKYLIDYIFLNVDSINEFSKIVHNMQLLNPHDLMLVNYYVEKIKETKLI